MLGRGPTGVPDSRPEGHLRLSSGLGPPTPHLSPRLRTRAPSTGPDTTTSQPKHAHGRAQPGHGSEGDETASPDRSGREFLLGCPQGPPHKKVGGPTLCPTAGIQQRLPRHPRAPTLHEEGLWVCMAGKDPGAQMPNSLRAPQVLPPQKTWPCGF